jgi:hypothetical protein
MAAPWSAEGSTTEEPDAGKLHVRDCTGCRATGIPTVEIGNLRRELLDHVVVLGQQHLIRLVNSYIWYYHEDCCHLGVDRDTPDRGPVTSRPSSHSKVVALPRVGRLHHRLLYRK